MATASPSLDTTLEIKRTFQASREKVFQAWTDPEKLNRWFAPSDDYEVSAECDPRPGGNYRVQMTHKDGNIHTVVGEYREVNPPEKLVFTWSWEDGGVQGSLVTVDLQDLGESTEVTLTHSGFLSAEWRDKHNEGWSGALSRLEAVSG